MTMEMINLVELLQKREDQRIREWLKRVHPIDLSYALDELEDKQILAIYELMEYERLAETIEEADDEIQVRLLKLLKEEEMIQIFSYMAADNVTDIIGHFSISEIKHLLKMMQEENAGNIRHLLGYNPETAGSIMTTEFIALKESLTVQEAWLKIKEIASETEVIETVFILSEVKQLVGIVDLRDLIVASDEQLLQEITDSNLITVRPNTDQEEVALMVSRYNLSVMPVINRKGALIGIITVDDIIDVIEEENSEDMFKMVGIRDEEQVESSIGSSISRRLPWLYVNLATAFLASLTIGLFEDIINQVVVLAVLLPIVAGMGGNSGLQTLSITIRGIALGELDFKNTKKVLFKEIGLGLIQGAAIGMIAGMIVYFWHGNPYLGLVIFLAMIGNMIIAGLSGFLIPIGLKAVGVDPALASAIILTTATDVLGFFVFLTLANFFLKFLM